MFSFGGQVNDDIQSGDQEQIRKQLTPRVIPETNKFTEKNERDRVNLVPPYPRPELAIISTVEKQDLVGLALSAKAFVEYTQEGLFDEDHYADLRESKRQELIEAVAKVFNHLNYKRLWDDLERANWGIHS